MIRDIIIVCKKEFLELKKPIIRLMPMSGLILLPLLVVAMQQGGGPDPLLPARMIVSVLPSILGGSIAYELVRGNIQQERREKTLEILLISDLNKYAIVIGKAIPGSVLGSIIALLGNLILGFNSEYRALISLANIVSLPFLIYVMNQASISASVLVKDEKSGTFLGVFLIVLLCIPIVLIQNAVICFLFILFMAFILTTFSTRLLRLV